MTRLRRVTVDSAVLSDMLASLDKSRRLTGNLTVQGWLVYYCGVWLSHLFFAYSVLLVFELAPFGCTTLALEVLAHVSNHQHEYPCPEMCLEPFESFLRPLPTIYHCCHLAICQPLFK